VAIGIQLIERFDTHVEFEQLYIAKAYQRRGFGTELVKRYWRRREQLACRSGYGCWW
jgi:hypothetical protein